MSVGLVAGDQREAHRRTAAVPLLHGAGAGEQVHLADRPVDDERLQRLLRAPRRGGARRLRLRELNPGRRLLVGELEVGELAEIGQRAPAAGTTRLGVGDRRIRLARASRTTCDTVTAWLSRVAYPSAGSAPEIARSRVVWPATSENRCVAWATAANASSTTSAAMTAVNLTRGDRSIRLLPNCRNGIPNLPLLQRRRLPPKRPFIQLRRSTARARAPPRVATSSCALEILGRVAGQLRHGLTVEDVRRLRLAACEQRDPVRTLDCSFCTPRPGAARPATRCRPSRRQRER